MEEKKTMAEGTSKGKNIMDAKESSTLEPIQPVATELITELSEIVNVAASSSTEVKPELTLQDLFDLLKTLPTQEELKTVADLLDQLKTDQKASSDQIDAQIDALSAQIQTWERELNNQQRIHLAVEGVKLLFGATISFVIWNFCEKAKPVFKDASQSFKTASKLMNNASDKINQLPESARDTCNQAMLRYSLFLILSLVLKAFQGK